MAHIERIRLESGVLLKIIQDGSSVKFQVRCLTVAMTADEAQEAIAATVRAHAKAAK